MKHIYQNVCKVSYYSPACSNNIAKPTMIDSFHNLQLLQFVPPESNRTGVGADAPGKELQKGKKESGMQGSECS
jgi:hypothetical protein